MIKKRLETKQDYLDFCVANRILNIEGNLVPIQRVEIDGGILRGTLITGETEWIGVEPKSYPVVLVCEFEEPRGLIKGIFVYPSDF